MIKKAILFLFLFLFLYEGFSQITFQKKFEGIGQAVYPVLEGGYVMAGYSSSIGAGDLDFWLLKTNVYGDTIFTKTYGGISEDKLKQMNPTADGGYILVGGTYSFGAGSRDFYAIKTDAYGDTLWTRTYGGTDDDLCFSVIQTNDGGYAMAGHTYSYGAGNADMYLVKTDAFGDTLWTRTYGGNISEQAYSIQQTLDGGYILSGLEDSFDPSYNTYVVRTDALGNVLWSKSYGGSGSDGIAHIVALEDDSFIIGGDQNSFGAGNYDFFLFKIDNNGNILWQKAYGGFSVEGFNHIQKIKEGGFLLLGSSSSFSTASSAGYALCVDSLGNFLWSRVYDRGSLDDLNHGYQTADKGFIFAAYYGAQGAALIKTDSLGKSGCNDKAVTTTVSNMNFTATNPATVVTSGGIVGSTSTIVGSGGIMETYCIHVDTTSVFNPVIENIPGIKIFPNPAADKIRLEYSPTFPGNSILDIYNSIGQKVESMELNGNQTLIITLEEGKYKEGVYILTISSDGLIVAKEKLVVMPTGMK